MSLETMYPTMFAPPAVTAPVASAPRENVGMRLQAGDNSPAVELQPNRGIALQAGDTTIEKAAPPANPVKEAPETVTSPEAPAPITSEVIATLLSPEIKALRASDSLRNTYSATYNHLVPDETPAHAPVAHEIRQTFYDADISPDTVSSLKTIAAKFKDSLPDAATLESWGAATTATEKAAFAAAIARNQILGAVLSGLNISKHPTVIRAFGSSISRK